MRRHDSTINNRPLHVDVGKEWTTARCHRLLRALTSRVAILKKDIARFSSTNNPAQDESSRIRAVKRTTEDADGDWNQTQKRLRQTYSSKGRKAGNGKAGESSRMLPPKKGRRSMVPGEVVIPTPILARARSDCWEEGEPIATDEVLEGQLVGKNKRRRTRYAENERQGQFQLSSTLSDMRERTSATRFTTYEGIYNGLEALLKATAPENHEVKRKGARSLFSIALRAVPKYVKQQEDLMRSYMEETSSKTAIASRDVSTETYDELEAYGSFGNGWKHLRLVVRSHGIQVITDAIRTGLLEADLCGCLVTLCLQSSAMDEAHTLFSALLSSAEFSPARTLYDKPNRLVSMLWKFTEHIDDCSFQYRELSNLFAVELLPLQWLATREFAHIWTKMIQSLSPTTWNTEALVFLDTLLPLLSVAVGQGQDKEKFSTNASICEAGSNTFSSLLTTLTSIIILSKEKDSVYAADSSPSNSNDLLHISRLFRSCIIQHQAISGASAPLPMLAEVIARFNTSIVDQVPVSVDLLAEQLRQRGGNASNFYAQAVLFICQTARCCGRGALNSGFQYLQSIHRLLEACATDTNTIFRSLVVDSAFAFAEQVPDRMHLDYATNLDDKLCVRRFHSASGIHDLSAEERNSSSFGFRWEEGIGEWVTATPLVARKIAVVILSKADGGCDASHRSLQNLRSKPEQIRLSTSTTNYQLSSPLRDYTSAAEVFVEDDMEDVHHGGTPWSEDELGSDFCLLESSFVSNLSTSTEASLEEISFSSSMSSVSSLSAESVGLRSRVVKAQKLNSRTFHSCEDLDLPKDSALSVTSYHNLESPEKRLVGRAPRLGRKALRSSQTWHLFDEGSDDELSILSIASQGEQALHTVTDNSITSTRRLRRCHKRVPLPSVPRKSAKRRIIDVNDSEDELCM